MVRASDRDSMGRDEARAPAPAPAPAPALDFKPSEWKPSSIIFSAYNAMQSEIQRPNRPLRSLRIVVSPPIVVKLTKHLVETYNKVDPAFTYSEEFNPKRYLTNPSAGVSNSGLDNKNSDLILAVNAVLVNSGSSHRYVVKEMLGQGTFGQVVKCWSENDSSFVAVKVIKNQAAYYQQAIVEIEILRMLNSDFDPDDRHHIVRIIDWFIHQNHLCIAFELLSHNLYELLKVNRHRGISLQLLRNFTKQILNSLVVLRDAGVIHCDLKPENILLSTSLRTGDIKLIDFGSACKETRTVYSYIQSRFYRSPEVVLGHPYTTAIDMWSLGCVAAELFLGLPLFAGDSEYDLLRRMIDTLGCQPPVWLLRRASNTSKYFKHASAAPPLDDDTGAYQFLTSGEYKARENKEPLVGKTYLKHTKLEDIISKYPYKSTLTAQEKEAERQRRLVFLDFLRGLVRFDPITRWTPRQASQHPFITEEAFTGCFEPVPETPRTPIAYGMTVDHNPGARGHWFAAGLSPQVSYLSVGHNHFGSPQYPFSFASSYGSIGSGVGSYDGYGGAATATTTSNSYDWTSMYHPTPPGGPPVDWRRMYPNIPQGCGPLGISPSSSVFQPVSLGGSPSQFTPPGSQFPSPQSSPGRFGPPSPRYGKGAFKQQRRGFVPPPASSGGIPLPFDSGRQQNGGFDPHLEAGTSGSHTRGSHLRPSRGSFERSPGYRAGSLEAYLSVSELASEAGTSSEIHTEFPASHPDSGDWFPNDSNDLLEEDRLASGSGGARLGPGQGFEAHHRGVGSMRRLNHHMCETSGASSSVSARGSLHGGSYDEAHQGGFLLQSYGGGGAGGNHNHNNQASSSNSTPFSSPQHSASLLSRQLNSQHHHLYHHHQQQQQLQQQHHHQRPQRAPPPPIYHPDYPQAFIGFPAGYQCPASAHEQHVAGVAR